ncbi:hypothetical protein [Cohnella zeiphila]|uniref:Uncharacterized protein n=1 Tax=Cohnella zeiphila TaxID=2761120 RepID=A0A7X0SME8_9BACL|nr:hypothetical protein [Cohnella zeiphila]MBB6732677.1 hypothetical protein [Cohnella zeiphila]
MVSKYPLKDKPGRTMFVFERSGKFCGNIIKDHTDKEPAKLVFETERFDSIEALKEAYPPADEKKEQEA